MANELQARLERELAGIRRQEILPQLVRFYVAIGGDLENVEAMLQLMAETRATAALAKIDLPGPDKLVAPKVLEFVERFVSEWCADIKRNVTQ